MPATAEIITIGDEILYGQTLDTNSHWISEHLDMINIKVFQKTTIGDTEEHILTALTDASSRVDVVLITGGLGPTSDDLTKPTLAKYFGVDLVLNQEALQEITDLFTRAGRPMTIMNEQQALLPDNCEKVTNKMGTAPGMWFDENDTVYISMPGVPYEMKSMMEEYILPRLSKKFQKEQIVHKIIRTVGIAESRLADIIKDWQSSLPSNQKLAYLPSFGQVKLRITGTGSDRSVLDASIDTKVAELIPLIDEHVYGFDNDELEEVVGQLLLGGKCTLATAESCTGGNVAATLTSVPGSSAYFVGSVIAYDNSVKKKVLNVKEESLARHGAVSEEVVKQMAEGVRMALGADIGLSTSGIAGPTGGTPEKPVGTIWFGYSDKHRTIARKMQFTKNRQLNIKFATVVALNMFRVNFKS